MDVSDYRFCPMCGRTPLTSERGGRTKRCRGCQRTFYSAPHAAVAALIVDEQTSHLLLTRRGVEPFKDEWDLPGGFLDIGESLEEALHREVREELGIDIRIREFTGSYPDVYGAEATPVIAAFYVATIAKGAPATRSEVSEFRWFARDDLPQLAFENCRRAVAAWRDRGGELGESGAYRVPPRVPATSTGTILLIEDDDLVRELMAELLADDGYTVLEAGHPATACDLAQRYPGPIDLLLTDVIMPGMNGRDAAQRIRGSHPETKVMYISGYPEHEIEQYGVYEPGVSFLGKPFAPPALRQKVREVLASRG